jgi:acyl-CoA thioester hydrolase
MTPTNTLAARCAAFHFSQPIAVRLSDFDLFGHVNNAFYLTYCEAARIGYWETVSRDAALQDANFILAHASVDYRRPIHWGAPVRVLVRAIAVGSKSFTLEYLVLAGAGADEFLAAEARSVQVMYDYEAARSVPLPPPVIACLESFEGRPLRG